MIKTKVIYIHDTHTYSHKINYTNDKHKMAYCQCSKTAGELPAHFFLSKYKQMTFHSI